MVEMIVTNLQTAMGGLGEEIRDVAEDIAANHIDPSTKALRTDATTRVEMRLRAAFDDLLYARSDTARHSALVGICGASYLLLAMDEAERGEDVIEAEMAAFHANKRSLAA